MTSFSLDPQLAADTIEVGDLDLSSLRLMNDARFPWTILVPRRPGLAEMFELTRADRTLLTEEVAAVSEALSKIAAAHKINVAALGNQVRQLHVHVIARQEGDAAWPWPVWGKGKSEAYATGGGEAFAARLAGILGLRANANRL